jgi:hypothetical protein
MSVWARVGKDRRRAREGAEGGAPGARKDRLLGIGHALGNQAMGSLLAGGAPGPEGPSSAGAEPRPLRLRLTPEEMFKLQRETPEVRPEGPQPLPKVRVEPRMEPPPAHPLAGLSGLADEVLDRILRRVGVEDPMRRAWFRDQIKANAQAGIEGAALEHAIDSLSLEPERAEELQMLLETMSAEREDWTERKD